MESIANVGISVRMVSEHSIKSVFLGAMSREAGFERKFLDIVIPVLLWVQHAVAVNT